METKEKFVNSKDSFDQDEALSVAFDKKILLKRIFKDQERFQMVIMIANKE